MAELASEVRVVVARLRNLFVDIARQGAFANPLDEIPHAELEPRQLQALWWLHAEGLLTVNALAERMGLAMPPMTRLLDRLEELGLVVRHRGTRADKRHVLVRLTEKGRVAGDEADGVVQERLARLLLPLEGEYRSELLDSLERWVEALAREPEPAPAPAPVGGNRLTAA
ncbi:MarR family transcriptional regulator [Archangium minus]|uniref:MarR family transcriptional regulator n=1 Tax=Archangium minus TaxID=83450 RepID=A0ABY9X8C2_9BACT|nr:MarR family transcriptional regulator [Archangium minus]